MDVALSLSKEQISWLKNVAATVCEKSVNFAKEWEDGIADVIVFDDNSYIWCFPSDTPYVQGDGTFHFPRFSDKDKYEKAHERLEKGGFSPTPIGDFSDKTGLPSSNGRIGQYTFHSFNVKGQGLNFEVCLEPDHDWTELFKDELI